MNLSNLKFCLHHITSLTYKDNLYEIFRTKNNYELLFFKNNNNNLELVCNDEYPYLFNLFASTDFNLYNEKIHFIGENGTFDVYSKLKVYNEYKVDDYLTLNIHGEEKKYYYPFIVGFEKQDKTKDVKFVCEFVKQTLQEFLEEKVNNDNYRLAEILKKNRKQNFKICFSIPSNLNHRGSYNDGKDNVINLHTYLFNNNPQLLQDDMCQKGSKVELNTEQFIKLHENELKSYIRHEFAHNMSFDRSKSDRVGFINKSIVQINFEAFNEYMNVMFSKYKDDNSYKNIIEIASRIAEPSNKFSYYMNRDMEGYTKWISKHYNVDKDKIYNIYLKLDAVLNLARKNINYLPLRDEILTNILTLEINKCCNTDTKFQGNFDNYSNLEFNNLKTAVFTKEMVFNAKKAFLTNLLTKISLQEQVSITEKELLNSGWLKKKCENYEVDIVSINNIKQKRSDYEYIFKNRKLHHIVSNMPNLGYTNIDDYIELILMFSAEDQPRVINFIAQDAKTYLNRPLNNDDLYKLTMLLGYNEIKSFKPLLENLENINDDLCYLLSTKMNTPRFAELVDYFVSAEKTDKVIIKFLENVRFTNLKNNIQYIKLLPKEFLTLNVASSLYVNYAHSCNAMLGLAINESAIKKFGFDKVFNAIIEKSTDKFVIKYLFESVPNDKWTINSFVKYLELLKTNLRLKNVFMVLFNANLDCKEYGLTANLNNFLSQVTENKNESQNVEFLAKEIVNNSKKPKIMIKELTNYFANMKMDYKIKMEILNNIAKNIFAESEEKEQVVEKCKQIVLEKINELQQEEQLIK